MSSKNNALRLGWPPINHRSVVVVCQARKLMLAGIIAVIVSISGILFLSLRFLTLLISPSSVSRAIELGEMR